MEQTQDLFFELEAEAIHVKLFTSYSRYTNMYAVCTNDGEVIYADDCFGANMSQNEGQHLAVERTLDLVNRIQMTMLPSSLKFTVCTDAQWLVGKKSKRKGKTLRDIVLENKLDVKFEWVKGDLNSAKKAANRQFPYKPEMDCILRKLQINPKEQQESKN